jgi:ABC-2 type transport system ATP-binding protein
VRADGAGLTDSAVQITELHHRFGERVALAGVSFDVRRGELLAILGPNGSGKTTLFRILSTALVPDGGSVRLLEADVVRQPHRARRAIGVVFQAPSLDRKLTAAENLRHQGRLYGLRGQALEVRIAEALAGVGVADRARERVERLSGGLARRVELAKGLLHRPAVLLLDEPTTGLDPSARRDFWTYLERVRRETGATVVLTTHLMDEAERSDRVAILDAGHLVALDTPAALTAEIGGEIITVTSDAADALAERIRARFSCPAVVVERTVRIEQPRAHDLVARLVEAFPEDIRRLTLGRPTLDDVFVRRTGHAFRPDAEGADA